MMEILFFITYVIGMVIYWILAIFATVCVLDIVIDYVVREDDVNYPKEKRDKEQSKLIYPSVIIGSIATIMIKIYLLTNK